VTDGLTAKGYLVERITAYRTAAPAGSTVDPDRLGRCDAVVFFSPSAVDRYVALAGVIKPGTGAPQPPLAFCVGPSTGERAQAGGFREVIVPDVHSQTDILVAIADRLDASSPRGA